MPVKEILMKYLKDNKYDGLTHNEKCGCTVDDLILCFGNIEYCRPAYKLNCNKCKLECNWKSKYGWCMKLNKGGK